MDRASTGPRRRGPGLYVLADLVAETEDGSAARTALVALALAITSPSPSSPHRLSGMTAPEALPGRRRRAGGNGEERTESRGGGASPLVPAASPVDGACRRRASCIGRTSRQASLLVRGSRPRGQQRLHGVVRPDGGRVTMCFTSSKCRRGPRRVPSLVFTRSVGALPACSSSGCQPLRSSLPERASGAFPSASAADGNGKWTGWQCSSSGPDCVTLTHRCAAPGRWPTRRPLRRCSAHPAPGSLLVQPRPPVTLDDDGRPLTVPAVAEHPHRDRASVLQVDVICE
jgi:hypothetical protein